VIRVCQIMTLSIPRIIFEKLFLCKQSHLVGFRVGGGEGRGVEVDGELLRYEDVYG